MSEQRSVPGWWVLFSSFVLSLFVALHHPNAFAVAHEVCGNKVATSEDTKRIHQDVEIYQEDLRTGRIQPSNEPVVIPVCSFIMADLRGRSPVSDEQLQLQMDALNWAFSAGSCCNLTEYTASWCDPETDCSIETGFRFAWAVTTPSGKIVPGATTPHVTDEGACSYRKRWLFFRRTNRVTSYIMRRRLRKGGAETLHVFWSEPRFAIGYATLPGDFRLGSQIDGIVIRPDAIAGGSFPGYNTGKVLVHEVGHWLGLHHTFSASCDYSDGIDDTPKEFNEFRGCGELPGYPLQRDTCPGDDGLDPVHNYMDYSGDLCWFEFSYGQITVMQASWHRYRSSSVINLQPNVTSDAIMLVAGARQVYTMVAAGPVRCEAKANEGRLWMFLRWNRVPSFGRFRDRCAAFGSDTNPSCRIRARRPRKDKPRVLFIGILAVARPVGDLQVTCWPDDGVGGLFDLGQVGLLY